MGCWQTLVGVSCVLHSANMPSRLLLLIVIDGVLTRQTQHDIVTFYDDKIAHRPAESDMFSRARTELHLWQNLWCAPDIQTDTDTQCVCIDWLQACMSRKAVNVVDYYFYH